MRYYLGLSVDNFSSDSVLCEFMFLIVGGMLLYLVGVADDLVGVGYRYKFIVQIIAACLMILPNVWFNSFGGLLGIDDIPSFIGVPFTILLIVFITNAINLIDGIDGLASGLSCIALAVLGCMNMISGEYIYALVAFVTFGVIIPFWFYNVFGNAQRGHKLFMGDGGSLTLGYILSLLVIHMSIVDPVNIKSGNPGMVIAFSTLIVPLFDVVRVVLYRLRVGKNPFMPDKSHIHHKLLRTGMHVRSVLVTILAISLFFIGMNTLLAGRMDINGIFILDIVFWILIQLAINHAIKKHEKI